ncbi:hypothetical protein HDU85_004044 [Gaertneriomyces sp. JEL0708]|nr:hypothetical protein HDU85_004044 [Gaertneriomyces sp. JEL0708]
MTDRENGSLRSSSATTEDIDPMDIDTTSPPPLITNPEAGGSDHASKLPPPIRTSTTFRITTGPTPTDSAIDPYTPRTPANLLYTVAAPPPTPQSASPSKGTLERNYVLEAIHGNRKESLLGKVREAQLDLVDHTNNKFASLVRLNPTSTPTSSSAALSFSSPVTHMQLQSPYSRSETLDRVYSALSSLKAQGVHTRSIDADQVAVSYILPPAIREEEKDQVDILSARSPDIAMMMVLDVVGGEEPGEVKISKGHPPNPDEVHLSICYETRGRSLVEELLRLGMAAGSYRGH